METLEQSYAANFDLLDKRRPDVPSAARSRAAMAAARARLSLEAACTAQGFDLHAEPTRTAAPAPAPQPSATTVASRVPATAARRAPFTPEDMKHLRLAGEIMVAPTAQAKRAIIARAESEDLATRAKALQERDGISFRAAVERLSVTR